jgi:hypothetical protein
MSPTKATSTKRKRGTPRDVRGRKGHGIGVRFDPPTREALDKAASETHRSLSNLIAVAMIEWLERNGYLKK